MMWLCRENAAMGEQKTFESRAKASLDADAGGARFCNRLANRMAWMRASFESDGKHLMSERGPVGEENEGTIIL